MATYHGKNCYFAINDSGGTLRSIHSDLQNANISIDTATADDTAFTDTWQTAAVGIPGYKVSIDGLWSDTTSTGTDVVLMALLGASAASYFRFAPAGSTSNYRSYVGSILLTAYNPTAAHTNMVRFTANFTGNGALTASTM